MTKIKSFIKMYYADITLLCMFIVSLVADNLLAAVIILFFECLYLHFMIELIDKEK